MMMMVMRRGLRQAQARFEEGLRQAQPERMGRVNSIAQPAQAHPPSAQAELDEAPSLHSQKPPTTGAPSDPASFLNTDDYAD